MSVGAKFVPYITPVQKWFYGDPKAKVRMFGGGADGGGKIMYSLNFSMSQNSFYYVMGLV